MTSLKGPARIILADDAARQSYPERFQGHGDTSVGFEVEPDTAMSVFHKPIELPLKSRMKVYDNRDRSRPVMGVCQD